MAITKLKPRLAGVLLSALALPALADTVDITLTAPTQREDGTLLPATEIAGYKLTWSVNGVTQPEKSVPAGVAYTLDTGTLVGKVCLTLRTVDTAGLESDPTAQVCRNSRPKAPTNVKAK